MGDAHGDSDVALVARHDDVLAEVAVAHEDSDGVDASGRPTNVHDPDAVGAAIDSSAAEFDRLDVVVNNGRTTSEGSEERTDVTDGNGEQ